MKELLTILQTWSGIMLLLVLAVIGIICSLAGSTSGEERRLKGQDDDHYVLRLPISRVGGALVFLIVGVVLEFVSNVVQNMFFADYVWIMMGVRLAIAVIFGVLFWRQLAKILRQRVFVNGERIIVTPAVGARFETNFKQIRTVANKLAGRDRGVIGKKIRTKEGNRFEVINTMEGYDRFCVQLNEKVELPDLTKKLFKKRDKKEEVVREPEETISQEPLPQASPVVSGGYAAGAASAVYTEEPVSAAAAASYAEPAAEEQSAGDSTGAYDTAEDTVSEPVTEEAVTKETETPEQTTVAEESGDSENMVNSEDTEDTNKASEASAEADDGKGEDMPESGLPEQTRGDESEAASEDIPHNTVP